MILQGQQALRRRAIAAVAVQSGNKVSSVMAAGGID